jgi:hypothetical protein
LMCLSHLKSLLIVTPKYLKQSTCLRTPTQGVTYLIGVYVLCLTKKYQ